MIPFYSLLNLICILSLKIAHCQAVLTPICSVKDYGLPNHEDCIMAFRQMPYAHDPSVYDARGYRLYSEPQLLLHPFHSVVNRYRPRAIVQLPKIWRYSESNV